MCCLVFVSRLHLLFGGGGYIKIIASCANFPLSIGVIRYGLNYIAIEFVNRLKSFFSLNCACQNGAAPLYRIPRKNIYAICDISPTIGLGYTSISQTNGLQLWAINKWIFSFCYSRWCDSVASQNAKYFLCAIALCAYWQIICGHSLARFNTKLTQIIKFHGLYTNTFGESLWRLI